jgi:hypothetical protein
MNITEKYVEFILEYLEKNLKVQLMEPKDNNDYAYSKMGPKVNIDVEIKVLGKYTRSANLLLTFDKYTVEHLFFMPMASSPDSILEKTHKQIIKIVNNAFINDGREDEIKKMYDDKRAYIKQQIAKTIERYEQNR